MLATKPQEIDLSGFKGPVSLTDTKFINNKVAYYRWLREVEPVHRGRMFGMIPMWFLSRYDDCVSILKDPRIVRNRTTAVGGSRRFPVPLPKAVSMLAASMINEDDPEHRRLRNLVHKAFVPKRLGHLEARIETLTHELLDKMEEKSASEGRVDLQKEYALPIPVTVIAEMVGIGPDEVPEFAGYMTALSTGLTGFKIFKTFFADIPKAIKFCRTLIERKRQNPADDILSGLIEAEEDGDKLTEDELISLVFLLIVAGYETTVHLITNAVQTLLTHPDQLALLRANPDLMGSAVEEINRFNGPILGTKLGYPKEDISLHGVTIKKGQAIMPLLGAGNFDPAVFENPELI